MFGKIVIDGSGEVPKHAVTPSSEFRVQRDTVEYGVSTRARISSEKNELNGRVIHTLDRLVVDAECAMNLRGLLPSSSEAIISRFSWLCATAPDTRSRSSKPRCLSLRTKVL